MNINIEELELKAEAIFKTENMPAIIYYLNKHLNVLNTLIKEDQYTTIVECAKYDGQQELIKRITSEFYDEQ